MKQEDQVFKITLAIYSGLYKTVSKTNTFDISFISYLVFNVQILWIWCLEIQLGQYDP